MEVYHSASYSTNHCCKCHYNNGDVIGRNLNINLLGLDFTENDDEDMYAIASGTLDGKIVYVVAGGNGKIYTMTKDEFQNKIYHHITSIYNNDKKGYVKIHGSTYNGKYFVLVGNYGGIIYSKDAENWKAVYDTGKYNNTLTSSLYSVCYNHHLDKFVAVGYDCKISVFSIYDDKVINYVSSQYDKTPNTSSDYLPQQLRFIIYDDINRRYILVGHNNKLRYCDDDKSDSHIIDYDSWIDVSPENITHPNGTTFGYQSVVYNRLTNTYVVVGNDGIIIYTNDITDRNSWKISDSGLYDNTMSYADKNNNKICIELQGISYDYKNNLYITVGWGSTILYTDDLTKRWIRYLDTSSSTTKYQFVINNPDGKIVSAGGTRVFIVNSVSILKRPSHLTNELLHKLFPIGYQFKKTIQYNPYNMYYFGTWEERYDTSSNMFTYTRTG